MFLVHASRLRMCSFRLFYCPQNDHVVNVLKGHRELLHNLGTVVLPSSVAVGAAFKAYGENVCSSRLPTFPV